MTAARTGRPRSPRATGRPTRCRLQGHRGLAAAFAAGLEQAVALGADVIVNTDGDNQYRGACVADLVRPILEGAAGMVVGDRQVNTIPHFSDPQEAAPAPRQPRRALGLGDRHPGRHQRVPRLHRDTALRLAVFSGYTYTLETIIQAGKKGIPVASVPWRRIPKLRESRLIRSLFHYLISSAGTILRIFLMYEPLRVFPHPRGSSLSGRAVPAGPIHGSSTSAARGRATSSR